MLLRHLLRPLDPTSLLLIAVFTAGFLIGMMGGFPAMVLSLLLFSWLFKYAYILLDSVANGVQDTPVLSLEMLNPFDEQRPLAQLVICACVGWLCWWVGGWLGAALGILGLLYLPASVAVLGVSARAVDAINPVALTRVITRLGGYYVAILGLVALYALTILALEKLRVPAIIGLPVTLFCILSFFCAIGGALFERRHALGLEATHAPERKQEEQERERSRLRARALDEVYAEARSGNLQAARESLLRWQRDTDAERFESDAHFFFTRAREWPDDKAFTFLARQLITQALERGKTGTAVELAAGIPERVPAIVLGTAADTLKLASLARAAGRRSLALRILTQFERRFPNDAQLAEATTLRRELER
ncbi:MAG: hypothetical protein IRZ28_03455 [Steroidobacteraceae bacterium]|nr:hypothetical protein [Steroidobacteraceae bacterium]